MKQLLLILLSSLLLSGCTVKGLFLKEPAGLEITTTPKSTVFINGENQGETPYSDKDIKAGEYTIKLIPTSTEGNFQTWEARITLDPQATTIINRTFARNETESSSYTLQLKPETDKSTAYISAISDPDTANISIDGIAQGFTPLTKIPVEPVNHTVEVASPGFKLISIPVNAADGYNLIIDAKLAREIIIIQQKESTDSAELKLDDEDQDSSEETVAEDQDITTSEDLERPYVVIEETETGWLRVRSKPTTAEDNEIGKADEGEQFKFYESNETGWYKIDFEGEEGWISGKYATLYQ